MLQQDIMVFVNDIYAKMESYKNGAKNLVEMKDMTFDVSVKDDKDNYHCRFIIKNVGGRVNKDGNIDLDSIEFILLIGQSF